MSQTIGLFGENGGIQKTTASLSLAAPSLLTSLFFLSHAKDEFSFI
jgi:hypothetical protein